MKNVMSGFIRPRKLSRPYSFTATRFGLAFPKRLINCTRCLALLSDVAIIGRGDRSRLRLIRDRPRGGTARSPDGPCSSVLAPFSLDGHDCFELDADARRLAAAGLRLTTGPHTSSDVVPLRKGDDDADRIGRSRPDGCQHVAA